MIVKRWLVFKISKYSHRTLRLVFKSSKYCHKTLWLVFKIKMLKTCMLKTSMLKTRMNEIKNSESKRKYEENKYEKPQIPKSLPRAQPHLIRFCLRLKYVASRWVNIKLRD